MSSRTITPIEGTNGRFEWYQYNADLRIIHCRDDDTFHAGSIIKALGSTKDLSNWQRLKQTSELMTGFMTLRKFTEGQLINVVPSKGNVNGVAGTYIHRLLVNHFAIWVSPRYAYKISVLLDDYFELQRQVEEKRALSDENKTLMQKVDEQTAEIKRLLDYAKKADTDLTAVRRDLSTAKGLLREIHADSKAAAPIASSLKNRVSSPLSEEYLLINYTENGNMIDVQYKAVNPNTIKRERLNVDSFWIHQSFANSVDAQNRLLDILSEKHMLLKLDRRTKTFMIRSYHLDKLRSIVENDLYESLNVESNEISDIVSEITDKANETPIEMFMGYPKDYCIKVCDRWHINSTILSKIIDKKGRYQRKYPIRLHPTDGLVYRQSVNGKTIYYKLPRDAFE